MSKKYSSFKDLQLITENWRKFLTEEEEGTFDLEKILGAEYTKFVGWLGNNIKDEKVRKFIASGLEDGGDPSDDAFAFSDTAVAVSKLIPTQNEVDIDKSLAFPLVKTQGTGFIQNVSSNGPFTLGDPIVIFNGKWIIDGHHRWSQLYACNKNASITAVNMTIEGIDPLKALKAVQMSIGAQTGDIPVQSVEGVNLLTIDERQLAQWIKKSVPTETYETIAAAPAVMKLLIPSDPEGDQNPGINEGAQMQSAMVQAGLVRVINSNIESMQQTSQPVKGAGPRDFMPQTGGVPWQDPLEKGQIDVKPPFAKASE